MNDRESLYLGIFLADSHLSHETCVMQCAKHQSQNKYSKKNSLADNCVVLTTGNAVEKLIAKDI